MVVAWFITLPSAGAVGAVMWFIGHWIGGVAGPLVVFAILVGLSTFIYLRSRYQPVRADNVNDEWDGAPAWNARMEKVS